MSEANGEARVASKVNKTTVYLLQSVAEMDDQSRPWTVTWPCEQPASAGRRRQSPTPQAATTRANPQDCLISGLMPKFTFSGL
jgi:hypothetical protein